ncbi:MAG: DNA-directed RNA polymerase subunit E'' [Candidatus Micrarchaeota archaeon]|nr:MAG: DNA-directed RNA polymerase subunit E'' [Candidatus Micrarchaeota archaeon]
MADYKACKSCRYITDKSECPVCGSKDLTAKWNRLLIVIDPERSEIAKKLNIALKGEYALEIQE